MTETTQDEITCTQLEYGLLTFLAEHRAIRATARDVDRPDIKVCAELGATDDGLAFELRTWSGRRRVVPVAALPQELADLAVWLDEAGSAPVGVWIEALA